LSPGGRTRHRFSATWVPYATANVILTLLGPIPVLTV
jgi:hypothetical protein